MGLMSRGDFLNTAAAFGSAATLAQIIPGVWVDSANGEAPGFFGETQSTVCYVFVEMIAQDEGDCRPNDYHYAVARAMGKLPSCKDIGKKAAARTLEMMGAKKLTTETLPIIIENRCAGRIFNGLISAMNGWALQQKRSFLLDKKGKKLAAIYLH